MYASFQNVLAPFIYILQTIDPNNSSIHIYSSNNSISLSSQSYLLIISYIDKIEYNKILTLTHSVLIAAIQFTPTIQHSYYHTYQGNGSKLHSYIYIKFSTKVSNGDIG